MRATAAWAFTGLLQVHEFSGFRVRFVLGGFPSGDLIICRGFYLGYQGVQTKAHMLRGLTV